MGQREVRPVAAGWEHPRDPGTYRDGSPRYRPLFSRADLLERLAHPGDYADCGELDLADYMPEIPEGAPFLWVLYETTTEGTPASPGFATLEELASWCETGATAWAGQRMTRAEWLAAFRAGTTDLATTARGTRNP